MESVVLAVSLGVLVTIVVVVTFNGVVGTVVLKEVVVTGPFVVVDMLEIVVYGILLGVVSNVCDDVNFIVGTVVLTEVVVTGVIEEVKVLSAVSVVKTAVKGVDVGKNSFGNIVATDDIVLSDDV